MVEVDKTDLATECGEYLGIQIYSNIFTQIYSYSKIFVPFKNSEYIQIFIQKA